MAGHPTRPLSGRRPRVRLPCSFTRRRLLLLLALTTAATAYVWPRTRDLDRTVTIDEPVFLAISANFFDAVAHRDFARTSQFLYPAVPIMWAGTLGYAAELPTYVVDHPDQIPNLYTAHAAIRSVGGDPLRVLVAARIAQIFLEACCFLVALWLVYRLFGVAVAAMAVAFIAFDPFLVAHDQLLHVDGVTGITAFASMLAATYADRQRTRLGLWSLAGAMAALCWLTRLTGLVLLPIILLLIGDGAISRYRRGTQSAIAAAGEAAKMAAVVIGASLATTVLLWPALWVDPSGTLQQTIAGWRDWAATPHPWGLYFAGKTVAGDPGILFYVFVFLYKITPFTLVGLVVVAVAGLFRLDPVMPDRAWRPVVVLATFVVVYSAGLAAGMRKFDRYILPDFPFLDLFAAIGVVGVARLVWATRRRAAKIVVVVAVTGLVAGQVVSVLGQRPYPLAYYNPLLGGVKTAASTVMVGWGEGLDQAARFILAQPDGATAVVRTSFDGTSLLYFLPASVTLRPLEMPADRVGLMAWADTDYAVTYILQWQRSTSGRVVPYLADVAPISTVRIDGVDFARVYDLRRIPPPDWMLAPAGCSWRFDGKVTFVAYGPRQPVRGEASGSTIELVFRTDATSGVLPAYQLRGVLHPKDGMGAALSFTTSLVPNSQPGLLTEAVAAVRLPAGRPLGDYWLEVWVIDPATGQPLPAVELGTSVGSDHAGRPGC